MSSYVHHVPGRLRVRTAAVKRNPQAAALARQSLSAVSGVLSAETNTLTGSVTVRYDPSTISQHGIFDVLQRDGYARVGGLETPSGPESVVNGYADAIAEKLTTLVVKRILKRSAVALIGALI
jgi:hypothetical protein